MNTATIIYIFIAFLLSFLVVYFQYFWKSKNYTSRNILAFLRWITLLSLFILLINPKIIRKKYLTVKPELIIAVDNSESILLNKQDSIVRSLSDELISDKDLNKKFRISAFSFGSSLRSNLNLIFDENKTNIYDALVGLNSLFRKETAPVVLISDGNQTYGNTYKYYRSEQPIFSMIIGDTVQPSDLKIDRINVNSFSYLNNNFPVEVFIHYTGNEEIKTKFIVRKNNKVVFSKNVLLSNNKNNEHITFKLPSEKIGKHLYTSSIIPFNKERNIINNTNIFGVEVIDEQSKIGLVYDILHPDIGMLKRSIETNKQRKVHLIDLNASQLDQKDIDVYILYQPNIKFQGVFTEISESNKNYFTITGTQTDWNFLNNIQSDFKGNIVQTTEKYFSDFDTKFSTFYLEDIGFSEFPPLENLFGNVIFSSSVQTILYNSVNGIEMITPMLAVYSSENDRKAILFGENIWKWRSAYYAINKSFVPFDQFINSIIQYLSIHIRKVPIELDYEAFYHANEQVKIKAKIYDSNFNFDRNAALELTIKSVGESKSFVLTGLDYEATVSNLKSGVYEFKVKDLNNGNQANGSFTIGEFSVEQELSYANTSNLKLISKNSDGDSFFPNQTDNLIKFLVQNKNFVSTQKQVKSTDSLIGWKWLLGLIIVSLSLEWFIRKYRGLV